MKFDEDKKIYVFILDVKECFMFVWKYSFMLLGLIAINTVLNQPNTAFGDFYITMLAIGIATWQIDLYLKFSKR